MNKGLWACIILSFMIAQGKSTSFSILLNYLKAAYHIAPSYPLCLLLGHLSSKLSTDKLIQCNERGLGNKSTTHPKFFI